MRNTFLMLFVAFFVIGCSNELDRPVTERLTPEELRENYQEDSTFLNFYKEVREMGDWISEDELLCAQYGEITYRDILDYAKKTDIAMAEEYEKIHKEYGLLYSGYDAKVDSIMAYWNSYIVENALESFVDIEFAEISKTYYSYSNNIDDVYVGFNITPLKGTVEQVRFKYEIKPKISNDGEFSFLNYSSCYLSSPIEKKATKYWKADYNDKKRLENLGTGEVKRDYDFLIEITAVRVNGQNYGDPHDELPRSVYMAIKYCSEGDNYFKDDIIKELLDPEYISFPDYYEDVLERKMKEIDPLLFSLGKEFDKHMSKQNKGK